MQTILLTGATGGIGKAIQTTLEAAGTTVTPVAHTDADLSSYRAVEALAEKINESDWIVCAHGFLDAEGDISKENSDEIQKTFDVNVVSLAYIVKAFLDRTKGFVFISSNAGVHPNGLIPVYSASKAAVNALTEAFARRYPEKHFIAVCPGATDTPMRDKIGGGGQSPEDVANVVADVIGGKYQSGDVITVRSGVVEIATRLVS